MKYCKFCGNKIEDEAVMCPFCRQSLIPNYKLTVERTDDYGVKKLVWKVVVDNNAEHSISYGEKLELDLSAGFHQLVFSFKYRLGKGSKTVNVNMQKDTKLLVCINRLSGGVDVFETSV